MLTLYATPGSGNCYKPFLAMRQLSIPFTICTVDVLKGETNSDAFKAINPAGKVPYLRLPGGAGFGESNAMLWFLAESSSLIPGEAFERAKALQWMFFEQARLEPFISPARFFSFILPQHRAAREAEIVQWRERAAQGLALLDQHLRQSDFVAGQSYSIADIAVYGYVHLSDEAGVPLADYPGVSRWCGRVRSTAGYVPISEMSENTNQPSIRAA